MYNASQDSIAIIAHSDIAVIPTDISIRFSHGTYAQLASQISMVINRNIQVIGGVINLDYHDNIITGL